LRHLRSDMPGQGIGDEAGEEVNNGTWSEKC
jgi:hypothetical protein